RVGHAHRTHLRSADARLRSLRTDGGVPADERRGAPSESTMSDDAWRQVAAAAHSPAGLMLRLMRNTFCGSHRDLIWASRSSAFPSAASSAFSSRLSRTSRASAVTDVHADDIVYGPTPPPR